MDNKVTLHSARNLVLTAEKIVRELTSNLKLNETYINNDYQLLRNKHSSSICINEKCLIVANYLKAHVDYGSPLESLEAVELILEHEEKLRKVHRQMILDKIYKIDPIIKEAADRLQRLSEDPEIVEAYHRRESELALQQFEVDFPDGIYAIPSNVKVKVRRLSDYCKQKGVTPADLSEEEMEQFLVRGEQDGEEN